MAFSGQTLNDILTATLIAEDVSGLVGELYYRDAPLLDWLGDSGIRATNIKHEYIEHYPLPDYIINSTAINSATAATGIQINGLGKALTVGTLLENETQAEIMQITSVVGANSVLVSRAYDGGTTGSLAAGGTLYVRAYYGVEGQDHSGANTIRLGTRLANTVGYLKAELSVSGSQFTYGGTNSADDFDQARARLIEKAPAMLEREVLRGVLNGANSLASNTTTRSMKGVRGHLTAIASTVTAASFTANPHLYIGNVWEQAILNGASATETWGICAGRTFFRDISNLNDTKVYDSNMSETFKRVIRQYVGPFGSAEIFFSRAMPASELLLFPRERVKVVPARPWEFRVMAPAGDNQKGMLIGEYTVEVHCANAMAKLAAG